MIKMITNSVIVSNDNGIVVKERSVTLSDEKLKGVMSKTYERAQHDMNTIKIYKFYNVFLSIAGTLLLTLLTSKFGNLGNLSAGCITIVAWVICIGCAITGVVFMGIYYSQKGKHDTHNRDAAVNEIFKKYLDDDTKLVAENIVDN